MLLDEEVISCVGVQEFRVGCDAAALVLDVRPAEGPAGSSAAGCAGGPARTALEASPRMRGAVYCSLLLPPTQGGTINLLQIDDEILFLLCKA